MSIITRSYFTGPLVIGNGQDEDSDKELLGQVAVLDQFIAKYEREVLVKCLGWKLYDDFMDQFTQQSSGEHTINAGADQKWKDLLNGKEYTSAGEDVVWRGLIFKDALTPSSNYNQSLIAEYIYAEFVHQNEYGHTDIGFERLKAKNSVGQSGRTRYVEAYNRFVKLAEYGSNYEVSLRTFIQDMNQLDSTTYPNWKMESFEYKNRFL